MEEWIQEALGIAIAVHKNLNEVTSLVDHEPALLARGFSKTFAGKTVLKNVDLDIAPGEIHGLLGHNGSGKSTFIKILSGYHAPDPGAELRLGGRSISLPLHPGAARSHAVSFVHQDLALADDLTILENLRIGRYRHRFGWRIDWATERRRAQVQLARMGLRRSPDALVSRLTGIERAMVAILRALDEVRTADQPGVLVLDEPTAYLSRDGADLLFGGVRHVAADGVAVLFVSHRLDEVKQITDRISVLRNGERVATVESSTVSERDLAKLILGRELGQLYTDAPPPRKNVRMRVRGLAGGHVRGFDFDLHEGETIGLTGLIGMGHEEVPYLLFGANKASDGTIEIDGRVDDAIASSPRHAIARGMALLPENRLRLGGAGGASLSENVTLPSLRRHFRVGFLRLRSERAHVRGVLHTFGVQPERPDAPLATLSGGNQQKALIAKWFEIAPRFLLLHEPTHGVDVGARQQIFQLLAQASANGCGILIASNEYEDLANLCDRVFVFRDGKIAAELSGSALTAENIVEACYLDKRILECR